MNRLFWALIALLVPLLARPSRQTRPKQYCAPLNASCWPNAEALQTLRNALGAGDRTISWKGKPAPMPSSVPLYSPYNQPLYGVGSKSSLQALYIRPSDFQGGCFVSGTPERRPFCLVATRNNPLENANPAFIVFPTNATQVAASVRFAMKHNLCIMVAGTGHDFLNRHSCNDGIFIRTTLLQAESSPTAMEPTYDKLAETITFGSGTTCSQATHYAASIGRVVACGWANTVGIAGWSMGGGHGPLVPSLGLGVDNFRGAELVNGNGDVLRVDEKSNPDLLYALRGGGGSTWGILTKLTLKAHPVSPKGYTGVSSVYYADNMCAEDGMKKLEAIVNGYLAWSKPLGSKYSGLVLITPGRTAVQGKCGGNWSMMASYVYHGPPSECNGTFQAFYTGVILKNKIQQYAASITPYETIYEYYNTQQVSTNYIVPLPLEAGKRGKNPGGVPSVVIGSDRVGDFARQVVARLKDCVKINVCSRQELYHDITGRADQSHGQNVSISSGFRNGLYHYVFSGNWDYEHLQTYYALGNNSYFSESAYMLEKPNGWRKRYWGSDANYQRLLDIKNRHDPNQVFWCRHCVGDSDT